MSGQSVGKRSLALVNPKSSFETAQSAASTVPGVATGMNQLSGDSETGKSQISQYFAVAAAKDQHIRQLETQRTQDVKAQVLKTARKTESERKCLLDEELAAAHERCTHVGNCAISVKLADHPSYHPVHPPPALALHLPAHVQKKSPKRKSRIDDLSLTLPACESQHWQTFRVPVPKKSTMVNMRKMTIGPPSISKMTRRGPGRLLVGMGAPQTCRLQQVGMRVPQTNRVHRPEMSHPFSATGLNGAQTARHPRKIVDGNWTTISI